VRIRRRFYLFLGRFVVVTLVVALVQTVVGQTSPSAGSASSSKKAATTTPRNVWGHPDLQGIWSSDGIVVPFQRAKEFGNRQLMTEEEHQKAVAELEKRNERLGRDNRAGRGTEKDVARAYNDLWFDKHKGVSYRTSQIIDPPDGRMPAYTPEAQARIQKQRDYLVALLQGTS